MCVCVYNYTCAPQEHIYIDFQCGGNLPSYKRQMSRRASIARAMLAHFWQWLPCVLVGGNLGCHMLMGNFMWLRCYWFSTSLDVVAQQFHAHFLPASMASAHCLYLHQGVSMGFRSASEERALESQLQPRVPKKSLWDKMVKINHVGGAAWPKKFWKWVLESPWVWALTLRVWVLTHKAWKSCSCCLFFPFFLSFLARPSVLQGCSSRS